jgi:hypothetical protein
MRSRVTFVLMFLAAAGCGSNSGVSSSSGLPRAATLATLTTAQFGTMCDWVNTRQGGYGQSVHCPAGDTQTTDDSKAACLSIASQLAALCPNLTVGSVEDCTNATQTELCAFPTEPACAPVRNCAVGGAADGGA